MNFDGIIVLSRELSFTEARQYSDYCLVNHIPFELRNDGRSFQWDKKDESVSILQPMAQTVLFFNERKISLNGVITASGTKKEKKYEVIVLNNRLKLLLDGKIQTIETKNIQRGAS